MSVFSRVQRPKVGRSVFNLSYEKKFTCDMGKLIPVMCDEVVPGDIFSIGNELVIRFQPLVAPILHEINAYVHYFFVPYRLLDENWEDFITGGVDGEFSYELPRWEPTENGLGSLWDYFGFPLEVVPHGALPIIYPLRAYNFIYNEYYRDETFIEEVDLDSEVLQTRAWEKDYFTAALPWQQRGIAPALPITGYAPVGIFDTLEDRFKETSFYNSDDLPESALGYVRVKDDTGLREADLISRFTNVDSVATFDVADLRLAFQVQKWLERNARAGARYTEFLRVHFGVNPRDDRLDRPEYLGGSKSPIVISEVLQTSSTDTITPQANMAGHGLTADKTFVAKYHVQEFGVIMGIMSVMPRTVYQQGIDRQWLRETKYDFYFPEFAHLSEQAVINAELVATDDEAQNRALFGYIGRYDEMRVKKSMVCSGMRDLFSYWHLARKFDLGDPPALNKEFLECVPRKDIFAVQDEHGLIVNFSNIIKAVRPMPIEGTPGLIDHF